MPTSPLPCSPLPDLIEESLEEARFLWRRWEHELTSLSRNLDEVWSWTEDRLHGALAGVRVSGAGLPALCEPDLTAEDLGQVTVGAALLAASDTREAANLLGESLRKASGSQLAALIRGLEVTGGNQALSAAASILASGNEEHAAALCRLKTFRRASPGSEMAPAFESNVPELQVEALRAVRYVPQQYLEDWINAGLRCSNPQAQLAAIESGIGRGVPSAWQAALDRGSQANAAAAPYLRIIAMLGNAEQHETVYAALRIPALQAHAVRALGHIGTHRAVEYCLHGMKHEKLAKLAGEAYCHITGADLARDDLAATEEQPEVPSFEEENLDASLVPSEESLWPLPDAEAVRRHWQANQSRFQPEVRHVRGRAISLETLLAAMEGAPMLRRPDLVLDLAARTRGAYDVECRAFAARQRTMLAQGRTAVAAGAR